MMPSTSLTLLTVRPRNLTGLSNYVFGIERKLVNKIREALDRIDSGTYGICEDCGAEIGEGRLKVRPVTTQCIDCKIEEEQREKRS